MWQTGLRPIISFQSFIKYNEHANKVGEEESRPHIIYFKVSRHTGIIPCEVCCRSLILIIIKVVEFVDDVI